MSSSALLEAWDRRYCRRPGQGTETARRRVSFRAKGDCTLLVWAHPEGSLWDAVRGSPALCQLACRRQRASEPGEEAVGRLRLLVWLEGLEAACSPGTPLSLLPTGVMCRLLVRRAPPLERVGRWPSEARGQAGSALVFLRYAPLPEEEATLDAYGRRHRSTLPAGFFRGLPASLLAACAYADLPLERSLLLAGVGADDGRQPPLASLASALASHFSLRLTGRQFARELWLQHADQPLPFVAPLVLSPWPAQALGYRGPLRVEAGPRPDEDQLLMRAAAARAGRLADWQTGLAPVPRREERTDGLDDAAGGSELLAAYDRARRWDLAQEREDQDQEEAAAGLPLCAICLLQPADRALVPCGHVLCDACLCQLAVAAALPACPWCRRPMTCCQRLFWPAHGR